MSNILESSWSPSFASCFASASTVNPPDPTRTRTERHYKNTDRKALQEHGQKGTTRTRTERHYKNTDRKAESINKEKLTLVSKVVETKEEFQLYYLLAFSFSAQIVCVFKFYTVIGHLSKQFAYKKARAPKDTGKVGVNGIGSEAALD